MKTIFSLAASAAVLIALPASAASLFTVKGNFSGTAAGNPFDNAFTTFSGVGDTALNQTITFNGQNFTATPLTSLSASSNGNTQSFTESFFFYTNGALSGFAVGPGSNLFTFTNSTGLSALGSDRTFAGTGPFSPVRFNLGANISATISTVAAVPEPTTWAMMLLGFGAVGGAARYRRRKANVAFA